MKRIWLWIVIAFVLGELACFAMDAGLVLQIGIGLILVLLPGMKIRPVFLWFCRHRSRIVLCVLMFSLGGFRMVSMNQPMEYRQGEVDMELRIEHVKIGKNSVSLFSKDTLVIADKDGANEYRAGNRICIRGRFQKIQRAANPGEFDMYLYYKSLNINRVIYAEEVRIVGNESLLFSDIVREVRNQGNAALQSIFTKKAGGFLQAVIMGDHTDLDESLHENFRYMGISHLLAISGLHVGILGLGLYRLLRKKLKLSFVQSGAVSGITLWFYAMLVGNGVSVIRASGMLLTVFIAEILGRSYDMPSSASVTAFFILLCSPFQLFGGGFLLSFCAVFSICVPGTELVRSLGLHKKDARFRWIAPVIITFTVFVFTMPLVAYFFFGFSPYSLLLNLLVIPMMGLVLYSGLAAMFLFFVNAGLAEFAGGLAHVLIHGMEKAAVWMRALPFSFVVIGRPSVWQMLVYYVLLTLLYARIIRRNKEEDEESNAKKWMRIGKVLFICVCLILFLRPILVHTRVAIMDVGQGDGILIQTGGENTLIDFGSTSRKHLGERTLEPVLLSLGIRRVHHVFLTHRDMDHINGIVWLLDHPLIQIENIYMSEFMYRDVFATERDDFSGVLDALEYHRHKINIISEGFQMDIGKSRMICLSPNKDGHYASSNEASLVLAMIKEEFCALFMGDAGLETERRLLSEYRKDLRNIALLKLGHHGSATSSGEEFLATTNPKYAMISYGENNRYRHPHREVVERLQNLETETYETAVHGAIFVETDGEKVRVRAFRQGISADIPQKAFKEEHSQSRGEEEHAGIK